MIDRCPSCEGIWFDRGELEAVLREAVKDLRIPPGSKQSPFRFCPRCGEPLYQFNYPDTYVNIDMCRKCRGLWIDPGEFKEIKAVRRALGESGKTVDDSQPTGIKASLLWFIDSAIDQLLDSF